MNTIVIGVYIFLFAIIIGLFVFLKINSYKLKIFNANMDKITSLVFFILLLFTFIGIFSIYIEDNKEIPSNSNEVKEIFF